MLARKRDTLSLNLIMMVEDCGLFSILEKIIRKAFLTLPRKVVRKLSRKKQTSIRHNQISKKTPHATQKEMAENISGATLEGIKYNLIRLQKNGALRRIGSDRDGFWEVIE